MQVYRQYAAGHTDYMGMGVPPKYRPNVSTLLVQPGVDEPHVDQWFKTIVASTFFGGSNNRAPAMFTIKFIDGTSEDIDPALAKYLIKKKLASARPQGFIPGREPKDQAAVGPGAW